MQQKNKQAPEFQDYDTRTWASFGQLASRWEQINKLDRNEMLNELLQAYLRGKIWPVILPNLYGGCGEHGAILTGSPTRPKWMKTTRRVPVEIFTRLDFLRAARGHGHLVHAKNRPLVAGYRGLIGVPPNNYTPFFIETYIKKLTPCPNAVMRWCSDHGWPVPPGLSYSETDVSAADLGERERPQTYRAEGADPTISDGAEKKDSTATSDPQPGHQELTKTSLPESPSDKPGTFRERSERWLQDMESLRKAQKISWCDAAKQIAGSAGVDHTTVEREARRIRRERDKTGEKSGEKKRGNNFSFRE